MTAAVAPEWAEPLSRVPFKDRGRGLDGADCWGLFRLMLGMRFGIWLPLFDEGYAGTERADGPQIVTLIQEEVARGDWHPVEKGSERAGDGILLRFHGFPMHVGGVLTPGIGLHTMTTTGACLLRYREMLFRSTVLGFYRHKDLLGAMHG